MPTTNRQERLTETVCRWVLRTADSIAAGMVEKPGNLAWPGPRGCCGWETRRRTTVLYNDVATDIGPAQYQDVIDKLAAAGLPVSFTQTGGMCAALEVTLETGHTLLITDSEDTLSWDRAEHRGWGVGLYQANGEHDDGPLVFDSTQDGSLRGLLPVIHNVLTSAHCRERPQGQ
jgi:hypothetical protein